MTLTYLPDKKKLDTLVYMNENQISDKEEYQNKQLPFIEIFLERFAKEMIGIIFTLFDIVEGRGVYMISWYKDRKTSSIFEKGLTHIEIGEEDYYKACIREFNEFVDKYLIIYEMIGNRMSKDRFTNSTQSEYRKHFYMYTEVRWDGDIKDLKLIVNDRYPRYTVSGGGITKLPEYQPFPYAEYGDPRLENLCDGYNMKLKNKVLWRPKKNHETNEKMAMNHYERGMKRLKDEEEIDKEI